MASRHLSRIAALQALFATDVREAGAADAMTFNSFTTAWHANTDSLAHDDEDRAFTETILKGVAAKQKEIDAILSKAAPQWPIEKIAAIDRNIIRLGLYELLYGSSISVPPKVALNEAIELAKIFGSDSSPRFVNGVLGAVYRDMGSPRKSEAVKEVVALEEHSAGAVVCAEKKDTWFVALVLDPFGKWTVPKSKLKEGELSEAAALRAAGEELGISVTITQSLSEHHYDAHDPERGTIKRTALYFVGCAQKEALSVSKKESVKDVQWFDEDTLEELSIYEDLREVIESGIAVAKTYCIDHD